MKTDTILDLEEQETEESFEFPPPERKILTQPYDLSVQTLLEQWEAEILIIPDIQREYVWDNGRASRLIESLILNIPVPPLFFAETKDARFEVIDGHQRVASIARFLKNEFALSGLRVLSEYMRKRFHQLPPREQRFLRTRSLRVIVVGYESHANMKFEVFERLNTGGITLNEQELRNSLYRGKLNNLLKILVGDRNFRRCINTKHPRKRMVDQELVLRFLALRDRINAYRPPLKRFLNDYMLENQNPEDDWLAERDDRFRSTMGWLADTFGNRAFRLIDESGDPLADAEGKPLPRGVNRALFDAQSLCFSWLTSKPSPEKRVGLVKSVSQMMRRDTFQDAVRRATGDRARIMTRISLMVQAMQEGGAEFDLPEGVV